MVSRARFAIQLGLVFLLAGVWCSQVGAAPDVYTSEFEKSPQPDFLQRDRQFARERQELYRTRVPIPHAVGSDVQTTAFIRNQNQLAAQAVSAAAMKGKYRDTMFLACLFLLFGVLLFQNFASGIADYLNERFNPWLLNPAAAANLFSILRAEDQAFSEFLAAFRAGPSALSGGAGTGMVGEAGAAVLREFFLRAPKLLAGFQALMHEITAAANDSDRRRTLADLQRELRALKGEAGHSELLPVWQMASALEGLVKQLTDKVRNITPSTLRTVSAGVELLKDLCVPGLKQDLLTNPPVRLLAVDDDRISRNAVSLALKKALSAPELAEDGETGLSLATQKAYDVIFLDVQMPGMDGFELCTRIHETVLNAATPVVFVTCASDFEARAQSTLSGGTDLIGKPFLTFEITVKALTLAVQGRLRQLGQAAGDQVPTKRSADSPNAVPASVEATDPAQVNGASKTELSDVLTEDYSTIEPERTWSGGVVPPSEHGALVTAGGESPDELTQAFLTRAAAQVGELREKIQVIFQSADENERTEMLADMYLRLHALTPAVGSAAGHPALRISVALEALVKKLVEKPRNCSSSTLLTVATALELLHELCAMRIKADLTSNPPIRLLVVDDDPVARRAITGALQTAFEKPENADGGEAALAAAMDRPFDVIFLDVQMPGIDGFAVCSRIRETVHNRITPVVFVTGHSDFKARIQSTLSGGNDLIGKPFLPAEATVKALTFAIRGRLRKLKIEQNGMQAQSDFVPDESSSWGSAARPDHLRSRRSRRRAQKRESRLYREAATPERR